MCICTGKRTRTLAGTGEPPTVQAPAEPPGQSFGARGRAARTRRDHLQAPAAPETPEEPLTAQTPAGSSQHQHTNM